MGCGASTLDPEDAALNRHSNPLRRHRVVRPITEEPVTPLPPLAKDDDVFTFPHNSNHVLLINSGKEELVGVRKKGGHAKPQLNNAENGHDRDDAFKGPGSPSFREYCSVFNPRCPSSQEYSNDDSDSGESTNNMRNDGLTMSKRKPPRKEITNPIKENEKKERKGRRFREVINKGRSGGMKMSFARHRSASKSNEDSRRVA